MCVSIIYICTVCMCITILTFKISAMFSVHLTLKLLKIVFGLLYPVLQRQRELLLLEELSLPFLVS